MKAFGFRECAVHTRRSGGWLEFSEISTDLSKHRQWSLPDFVVSCCHQSDISSSVFVVVLAAALARLSKRKVRYQGFVRVEGH